MYTNDTGVEHAIWRAVAEWAKSGGPGGFNEQTAPSPEQRYLLTNAMQAELDKLPEDHEVRNLKFKVKSLGRELGKAGARVYDLRCQVAEARSMNHISPGSYRANYVRMVEAEARADALQAQLKELLNPVPDEEEDVE
jgi:hypothetical protein